MSRGASALGPRSRLHIRLLGFVAGSSTSVGLIADPLADRH